MGINAKDLIEYIIWPSLINTGMYSKEASQLLAGTAAQESQLGSFLKQIEGPGLGLYQMEPKTHADIHTNYLKYRPMLVETIYGTCGIYNAIDGTVPDDELLVYNLKYATIMARLKYLMCPGKLPAFCDVDGQAVYWKRYYNSNIGKGDTSAYLINYERFVKPFYSK